MRAPEIDPLVNLSELTEIELIILKQLREFTMGDHRNQLHGPGFDFVGLREWQPNDRSSAVDWAQSSLTNFSPLIVREFEQPSTASVMAVGDASLSTRCGIRGVPVAAAIARAIGVIGMSAVFFQDSFGLITFDADFRHLAAVRSRIGRSQVIHCLDAYQNRRGLQEVKQMGSIRTTLAGFMRKTSLIPVISDFLFRDAHDVLRELSHLNSVHDVFLVLVDGAFAFEVPVSSAGWIETFDVETGEARVLSRAALRRLARDARGWQEEVERMAKDADLDVLRLGLDHTQNDAALAEFVAERRLRKR